MACPPPPAGEQVDRPDSTTADIDDPAGITGAFTPSGGTYPANSVVIWDSNSQYAAEATCTLPSGEHSRCTAMLDYFVDHYSQPIDE